MIAAAFANRPTGQSYRFPVVCRPLRGGRKAFPHKVAGGEGVI